MMGQLAMRLIRNLQADTRQAPLDGTDIARLNSSEDLEPGYPPL